MWRTIHNNNYDIQILTNYSKSNLRKSNSKIKQTPISRIYRSHPRKNRLHLDLNLTAIHLKNSMAANSKASIVVPFLSSSTPVIPFLNRKLVYRIDRASVFFLIMLTASNRVRSSFDYRVLGAANGIGEGVPERLLTRWRRSLSRCCECCPSMRCLACRTDSKGLTWPGNHARIMRIVNRNEQLSARENVPAGCWSKFKNRCRYCRKWMKIIWNL